MGTIAAVVLVFAFVFALDIFRVFRRMRAFTGSRDTRNVVLIHLLAALVAEVVAVSVTALCSARDELSSAASALILGCLVGLWISHTETLLTLLQPAGEQS